MGKRYGAGCAIGGTERIRFLRMSRLRLLNVGTATETERLVIAPEGTTKSAKDWHEALASEPERVKAL